MSTFVPIPPPVWQGSADLFGHLVPLADIDPDPKNVKKHPQSSLDAIRMSFTTFGQRKLVVVWRPEPGERFIMLAGNGTHETLKGMGWTHIACSEFQGPEHLARAFAIADNKTAEFSTWDEPALAEQLTWIAAEFEAHPEDAGTAIDWAPLDVSSLPFGTSAEEPKKKTRTTTTTVVEEEDGNGPVLFPLKVLCRTPEEREELKGLLQAREIRSEIA